MTRVRTETALVRACLDLLRMRWLCRVGLHACRYESRIVPIAPIWLDYSYYDLNTRAFVGQGEYAPQVGIQQRDFCPRCGKTLTIYHWDEAI